MANNKAWSLYTVAGQITRGIGFTIALQKAARHFPPEVLNKLAGAQRLLTEAYALAADHIKKENPNETDR